MAKQEKERQRQIEDAEREERKRQMLEKMDKEKKEREERARSNQVASFNPNNTSIPNTTLNDTATAPIIINQTVV